MHLCMFRCQACKLACYVTLRHQWTSQLAETCCIGLSAPVAGQVRKVDGKPVKNLPELMQYVEHCKEPYLRFDLDYNMVCASLLSVHATILVLACLSSGWN